LKKVIKTPLKIGLTGGIGSGKSTISAIFQSLGVGVYNSDTISKQLLLQNTEIQKTIIDLFEGKILTNRKIDTKKISQIIFNDKEKLKSMNSIIHPAIKKHFTNWLEKQKGDYIIKESAIIFETKIEQNFDQIILVKAPINIKIDRIRKRDNISKELILSIMKNQFSDDFLETKCDYIIHNNETSFLTPQALKIHEAIIRLI
jgi:dephospho-CoA kinase